MLRIHTVCYDEPTLIPIEKPYAILLVSRGEGTLRTDSDVVALQAERAFLVRNDCKLHLEGCIYRGYLIEFQKILLDRYLHINIDQQDKGLFDFSRLLPFADIQAKNSYLLMDLITQLVLELEEGSDVRVFQQYLFMLLWHSNRYVVEPQIKWSYEHEVMQKAMLLIALHYTEHRDTIFYADKLGMAERRLNTVAHKVKGKRFFQVFEDWVMHKAKELLLLTDKPIKEIAVDLGYGGYTHFDSCCRKNLQMSAARYRLLMCGPEIVCL